MTTPLLVRLSAGDRVLMQRCAIAPSAPWVSRAGWTAVTHFGGTGFTVLASALPWLTCCTLHQASRQALATLVGSHVIVQLLKRIIVRGRPAEVCDLEATIREPDRYSFPSGHATASMAVALAYGAAFPAFAVPLLLLAILVGFSRIRLGVHYPSDVLAGQLIAGATAAVTLGF
jgi:undecaprenyl-diphosphatase